MQPNPILSQLSADVSEREAHALFKSGQIGAADYSRVLVECRILRRMAGQQMALYISRPSTGSGCNPEGAHHEHR